MDSQKWHERLPLQTTTFHGAMGASECFEPVYFVKLYEKLRLFAVLGAQERPTRCNYVVKL